MHPQRIHNTAVAIEAISNHLQPYIKDHKARLDFSASLVKSVLQAKMRFRNSSVFAQRGYTKQAQDIWKGIEDDMSKQRTNAPVNDNAKNVPPQKPSLPEKYDECLSRCKNIYGLTDQQARNVCDSVIQGVTTGDDGLVHGSQREIERRKKLPVNVRLSASKQQIPKTGFEAVRARQEAKIQAREDRLRSASTNSRIPAFLVTQNRWRDRYDVR